MEFRNAFLPKEPEVFEKLQLNQDPLETEGLNLELDFIEQYRDSDGIFHVKTCFDHSDLDPADLWEVFDTKDGSTPLEILLPNDD
jgi:hypothetical protein